MTQVDVEVTPSARRTTLVAGTVGAIVEWYEYTVYATSAALVLGPLFFPSSQPGVSQVAAFASFGVGFLSRPIGAWVAGHMGDRIGRKTTLILTFSIMTVATALIGALPSYATVGVAAPLALCVLRLLQGFAVGGEWGGAAIIAVENAPRDRRGFYGAWPQIGVSCGLLLGTVAVAGSRALAGEQFLAWGWRLPFLFSALLAVVGLAIRLRAVESPVFVAAQAAARARAADPATGPTGEPRVPLVEVFRHARRSLLVALFASFGQAGTYYLFTVFLVSYVSSTLHTPASYGLVAVMVGSALNIAFMPVMGALSDRIGRRGVLALGAVGLIVGIWPIFALIQTGRLVAIVAGIGLFLGLVHTCLYAPLPSFYCELFETRVRYTGISLSYQIASILLSGFTPALASAVVLWANATWPLVIFGVFLGLITLVGLRMTPETRGIDLH